MSEFTTEDCKEAIEAWYERMCKEPPGQFKRIKKFKNEHGETVRHFTHKESDTVLEVIEMDGDLDVKYFTNSVGKNYLFQFETVSTLIAGPNDVCFSVVNETFYKTNGCFDSIHFTEQFNMPSHFNEEMESFFLVENTTEVMVRSELIALGFTEIV